MKEKVLYIVIAILLIVIASGVTYIVMDNKNNNPTKESEPKEVPKKQEPVENKKLTESEAKKLLEYVPFYDASLLIDDYTDAYSGSKVNIDNINENVLINMAISKTKRYEFGNNESIPKYNNAEICGEDTNPCEGQEYFKTSEVNKNLLKMYNKNSLSLTSISVPGGKLYKTDDYYIQFIGAGSSGLDKYSKNINGKYVDDTIEITEDVLFYRFSAFEYSNDYKYIEGKAGIRVYANSLDMKNKKRIGEFYIDSEYDPSKNEITNLDDYGNFNYTKFKHVFKKNSVGYYWHSTEVI